ATMTQAAGIKAGDKVLEIGTGSGYQAAVLAEIGATVYTIEIVDELAARTRKALDHLGYNKIQMRVGDGIAGCAEAAPYDAILVTAASREGIPKTLREELVDGGKMVIPVGDDDQDLVVVTRVRNDYETKTLMPVRFGPLVHTKPIPF